MLVEEPPVFAQKEYTMQRHHMVEEQLYQRGIHDITLLNSMRTVPREYFVLPEWKEQAYRDSALPIGYGQTISQPYMVAAMIQYAQVGTEHRVLEIGTGSGYAAAVLSKISQQVITVERIEALALAARSVLSSLGYHNIQVVIGDGSMGYLEYAPYDVIMVSAGAPDIPEPLCQQLKIGGRMIIPVGSGEGQYLLRVIKHGHKQYQTERLESVRFVPLIGEKGWEVTE